MNRRRSVQMVETGSNGEQAVKLILEKLGYTVTPGAPGGPDLIINGTLTVEVKTAHLTKARGNRQRRWQFCLFPHPERQQPFNEDLLILRCEWARPAHFVIPGKHVPDDLTKIDITCTNPEEYRGKWCWYCNAWHIVQMCLEGRF